MHGAKERDQSATQNRACRDGFLTSSSILATQDEIQENPGNLISRKRQKLFTKTIGGIEDLITDGSKDETSDEVKIFCISIETTLNTLE